MLHHVAVDHVLFVAIAIVSPILDAFWIYPRLRRQTSAGVTGARERFYRLAIATEWALAAWLLLAWAAYRRPWSGLWLAGSSPLRLGAGLAAAAIVAGLLWMQHQAIVGRPDGLERVRRQLASAIPLLPHSAREHRRFRWLALTAGICEEIMFRGFVLWYIRVWTGLVPAAAISCVVFGLAHAYLGSAHVLRTALFGVFMVLLVLVSGSLWPAVIVHAAVDLNSGDLSFRALSPGTPAP
jgi:membrane protease YdiL (CAAX protease family)